jgi:hypothetical protein
MLDLKLLDDLLQPDEAHYLHCEFPNVQIIRFSMLGIVADSYQSVNGRTLYKQEAIHR